MSFLALGWALHFVAIFKSHSMEVCSAFMHKRRTREKMTLNTVAAVVHSGLLIGLKCCANLYQQERTGSAAYLVWKERVANCRLGKALPKECTL